MSDKQPTPPRAGRTTIGLLAAAAALTVAALGVGVSDNPPGIALLYGAGLTLVLAFSHRWRNPRSFVILLLVSVAGFFLTAVIHNFAEVGAQRIPDLPALAAILSGISVVGFILAVVICPAGCVVGAVGGLVTAFNSGRRPQGS